MMKLLFDTNILLDVFQQRPDFYHGSSQLINMAEIGKINGCISAISFNNCFYILKRYCGNEKSRQTLRIMRDIFEVAAVNSLIINQAIDSDIDDFEDAIQYFSAIHSKSDYIITRNQKDFKKSIIPAISPEEFLSIGKSL